MSAEDDHVDEELDFLRQDLEDQGIPVTRETSWDPAMKGGGELLVVVVTSAPLIAGVVAAFRAWLERPARERQVTVSTHGRRFTVEAKSVESGTFERFLTDMLQLRGPEGVRDDVRQV